MSATNGTQIVEGWVWGADSRGTIDIIWTSILTIVLCSWNTLYLNVPPRHWTAKRRFGQKLIFFGLSILGPEFILLIAFGQWASARRSVKAFRSIRHADNEIYHPWTTRHAFLADMGCFRLTTEDCQDYPLDAKQVLFLVSRGYVPYSQVGIDKKEINDRDKGGGILVLITVIQIMWFSLNLNGRAWFGKSLTPLELTAIAFVVPTLATFWLWRHKPLDTNFIVTLRTNITVAQMREIHEREAKELDIPQRERKHMPLLIVGRELSPWNRRGAYNRPAPNRKIKIPDDNFPSMPRWAVAICILLELLYVGIHAWGWDLYFPTEIERTLWRQASILMGGCILGFWGNYFYAYHCHDRLSRISRKLIGRSNAQADGSRADLEASRVDPPMASSWQGLIFITVIATLYVMARGVIIVESFATLRQLPKAAYKNVMMRDIMQRFM